MNSIIDNQADLNLCSDLYTEEYVLGFLVPQKIRKHYLYLPLKDKSIKIEIECRDPFNGIINISDPTKELPVKNAFSSRLKKFLGL